MTRTMRKATYTPTEVQRLTETMFEIITSLPAPSHLPDFWDAIAGMRHSVALDILDLAEAKETVAESDGIEWGGTHDFYLFTEAAADLYAARSTDGEHGILLGNDAETLVRAALRAPGVAYRRTKP